MHSNQDDLPVPEGDVRQQVLDGNDGQDHPAAEASRKAWTVPVLTVASVEEITHLAMNTNADSVNNYFS